MIYEVALLAKNPSALSVHRVVTFLRYVKNSTPPSPVIST